MPPAPSIKVAYRITYANIHNVVKAILQDEERQGSARKFPPSFIETEPNTKNIPGKILPSKD